MTSYEVIVQHRTRGPTVLFFSSISPSLPLALNEQLQVILTRPPSKVMGKLTSFMEATANLNQIRNDWYFIGPKSSPTFEVVKPILTEIQSEHASENNRIHVSTLEYFEERSNRKELVMNSETRYLKEGLAIKGYAFVDEHPDGIDDFKNVIKTHINFVFFDTPKKSIFHSHLILRIFIFDLFNEVPILRNALLDNITKELQMMQETLDSEVEVTQSLEANEAEIFKNAKLQKRTTTDQAGAPDIARKTTSLAKIREKLVTQEEVYDALFLLLGCLATEDDVFIKSSLRLLVFTWNVAGHNPLDGKYQAELAKIFSTAKPPEIIVFSLQEVVELKAMSVTQELFGSSSNFKDWEKFLGEVMKSTNQDFVLTSKENSFSMMTLTFIHRRILPKVAPLGVKKVAPGLKGMLGMKGSLVTKLEFDEFNIKVSSSHLPAGSQSDGRAELIQGLYKEFCHGETDIFILTGDLNLRTHCENRQIYESIVKDGKVDRDGKWYEQLMGFDEVHMGKQPLLKEFIEGEINFPPTYKISKKGNEALYKMNRDISWTDRVFTWVNGKTQVKVHYLTYAALDLPMSDHRAVYAVIDLNFKRLDFKKARERCAEKFTVPNPEVLTKK